MVTSSLVSHRGYWPPVRMNICGIVTSPWTYRQPGHIGSRSYCQAIGTTDRTPLWSFSLMHRVHFFFFMPTSDSNPQMILQLDVLLGWWCVRYTLMSRLQASITTWLSHLWVLFSSEKLNRLHTSCMTHGSWNDALKWGASKSRRCRLLRRCGTIKVINLPSIFRQ
jgi:hypothetical protein